jgi:hypothetical protein
VDYRAFRGNKLIRRNDIDWPQGFNNHGMRLEYLINGEWIPADTAATIKPELEHADEAVIEQHLDQQQLSLFDAV